MMSSEYFRQIIALNPKVTRSTLHNLKRVQGQQVQWTNCVSQTALRIEGVLQQVEAERIDKELEKKVRRSLDVNLDLLDRPREAPPVLFDRTVQNVMAGSTPATPFVAPLVAPFQRA